MRVGFWGGAKHKTIKDLPFLQQWLDGYELRRVNYNTNNKTRTTSS